MMANGMLAGLVAITAPCAFVRAVGRGGHRHHRRRLVVEAVFFWEREAKIDDPVGAISVHGVCGTLRRARRRHLRQRQVRHRAGGAGIGWNGTTTSLDADGSPGRHRHPLRRQRRRPAHRPAHRRGRHLDRDLRRRLRLLQDPEHAHQGRHPLGRGRRDRRASTCPRWACSPTRSSASATASARSDEGGRGQDQGLTGHPPAQQVSEGPGLTAGPLAASEHEP